MERKDFLKKVAYGGSILLTAPILFSSCGEEDMPDNTETPDNNNGGVTIDLSDSSYSALNSVGGYAYKDNIIVFRTGESTYLGLSSLCTHSQCTVVYSHSNGNIPCPCHGSTFTTAGVVTNGPATTNLKKYNVSKNGNILTIT